MALSAARRWLKAQVHACWAALLLECAGLPLLRPTRGLEFLQSCGECFGVLLPISVACLFALGGLAAFTRDASAGTRADDAKSERPCLAVAIALPVHLRGGGRCEEAQMNEVAHKPRCLRVLWEQSRACLSTAIAVQTQRRWCAAALKELILPHVWSDC
ncbi:hypothetical protein TRVL_09496 [Trypanosoma vivax]|nr:hypothetical protein TRVL_09496 [Trypanosoma vivax]